ncbi:MAG: class III signal peptide-containing protein [Candidatus Omnitrophica bacterium]|nr:class III signal peptide-containing protein [Candidatus Omnitrophota bacterium]
MLIRLIRSRKAQSTAEYGILFAAVIAIAAGALTVSLKNAVQAKHDKSLEFMLGAGTTTLQEAIEGQEAGLKIYATGQEVRQTTNVAAGYVDEKVRLKGGAEESLQKQQTETQAISFTTIVAGTGGS